MGKLRITASTSFAETFLTDVVTDFLSRYPQTQVELIALERTVNLVEERIDLAVRIGNVLDDTLVARKLGVCRSVVARRPRTSRLAACLGRRTTFESTDASPTPTWAAPNSVCIDRARRYGYP